MKFIISGKHINVTDALKEKIKKKLGKVGKYFSESTEAQVTMSVEKVRQIIEVTIHYNGVVFRAEVATDDMYSSIDKAVDILERQIRKNKTRLEKRLHKDAFKSIEDSENEQSAIEEEHNYEVVKSKKFAIKPMTVEEAILQMNLVGHEFFVFSNADTKEVNVVYKRKDNNYGLIEPEF
ncbi:MAG: ribosome-associated translation inhibitor RaiA [Clostridiales bacterium]